MSRLVSALFHDWGPFGSLPGVEDFAVVDHHSELQKGDILIVHGGADISPALYNKKVSSYTWAKEVPSRQDRIEFDLMKRACELEAPIIGICRGGQMLCALAGGYLIQHVNNHGGGHNVRTNEGRIIRVNSLHHQMMQPGNAKHELIAWADERRSDVYYDEDNLVEVDIEPEYIYFPDVKGFAIQWHPEMMDGDAEANQYLLKDIGERLSV